MCVRECALNLATWMTAGQRLKLRRAEVSAVEFVDTLLLLLLCDASATSTHARPKLWQGLEEQFGITQPLQDRITGVGLGVLGQLDCLHTRGRRAGVRDHRRIRNVLRHLTPRGASRLAGLVIERYVCIYCIYCYTRCAVGGGV